MSSREKQRQTKGLPGPLSPDEEGPAARMNSEAFPRNLYGGPLIPSYFLEDSLPTRPNRSYLLTFLRVYH